MTAPSSSPQPRLGFLDAALLGGLAAFTALLAAIVLKGDPLVWVDILFDDAYYYLGVARNVAQHGVSQFLPPFQTNGYQPLWLILMSVLAAVFGSSERALPVEMLVATGLFIGLFALASKRWYGRLWPALFISAAYPAVMTWGLETVMMPAFVLAYLNSRSLVGRGLLASAVVLTRLDALAFIVINDLWAWAVKRERPARLGHWAILLPVLAAYFAINFQMFQTPVPVSGLAKAVGNHLGENLVPLLMYLEALAWLLPLLAAVLIARRFAAEHSDLRYGREMSVLAITTMVCAIYYGTMSGWMVWGWYLWPVMLLAYFLVLETCEALKPSTRQTLPYAALVMLITGALLSGLALAKVAGGTASRYLRLTRETLQGKPFAMSDGRKNIELVRAIHSGLLPKGAFVAMGDRAGNFGYFLGNDYRFLHTEGLVGPIAYVKAARQDKALAFVESQPIDAFIVDRERFLQDGSLMGVADPIQGWSAHTGPFLICFGDSAIKAKDTYKGQTRLVLDFKQRQPCTEAMQSQFEALRNQYGGVRRFSLPGEYGEGLFKWVNRIPIVMNLSVSSP